MDNQIVTRRTALIKKYEAAINGGAGEPAKGAYIVSTKPYHSTLPVQFDVVSYDATNQFAYAVCRKGQNLDFFSYGIGDQVDFGPLSRKANDADTNISKGKQTNGSADFVAEGVSLSFGQVRWKDAKVDAGDASSYPAPSPADADVVAAIKGERPVADPGSIMLNPQTYSPFNLENVLAQAIMRSMSCQFNWDEKRVEKLGNLMNLAQGGGGSQLRSNGQALTSNIFRVPEGYLWARASQTDSELVVRCATQEAVVIPVSLNNNPADASKTVVPANFWLDMTLKLHGMEFKYPSNN